MTSPAGRFFVGGNTMKRLINYLKDVRGELEHVSWPTRKQVLIYTSVVIGVSILTSLFLGLFDFIFSSGLERFIL